MIVNLFGSKTRYKLLQLFLTNPNRSFYVREITRKVDEQINSVRRELSNLLSIGIITSDSSSNKLYYEVNQQFDKYKDLVNLFTPSGSVSGSAVNSNKAASSKPKKVASGKAKDRLPVREKALGNVSLVVLSGVFTRDSKAPADVLIVGNVTPASLRTYVAHLESTIDKEISYIHLTEEQFSYRRRIKDRLTGQMLGAKLVVKVDKNNVCKSTS